MRDLTLQQAAKRLGVTRPALIERMRAAGLLTEQNLPTHPLRDQLYLRIKESQWFHPELGQQYSHSTRVRPAGLNWLADQLGIERPMPPTDPERRYAA